jgi:hypothetical protein
VVRQAQDGATAAAVDGAAPDEGGAAPGGTQGGGVMFPIMDPVLGNIKVGDCPWLARLPACLPVGAHAQLPGSRSI